jgi:hypothetical protein
VGWMMRVSRPVGAAVIFVVAAVAGVVGGRLTGTLGWALVVFVVLLLVGGGVAYWLERGSGSVRPAVGGSGGAVDLRRAKGVQIGDHNRQVNYFDGGGD